MKKNNLCKRCRDIVFEAAQYDYNPSHTNADIYKQFRQLEARIKELSYMVEREATKELI